MSANIIAFIETDTTTKIYNRSFWRCFYIQAYDGTVITDCLGRILKFSTKVAAIKAAEKRGYKVHNSAYIRNTHITTH